MDKDNLKNVGHKLISSSFFAHFVDVSIESHSSNRIVIIFIKKDLSGHFVNLLTTYFFCSKLLPIG